MRLSANFTLLSAISGGLSANLGFTSANRIFAVLIKRLIELIKCRKLIKKAKRTPTIHDEMTIVKMIVESCLFKTNEPYDRLELSEFTI
jgi:hypothetical protein